MDIRHRVGLRIQHFRRAKQWSQEELAHRAQVHRTYLSKMERGVVNSTITVIARVAAVLEVNIGQLTD